VLPRLLEVVGSSVEFDEVSGVVLLGVRPYGLPKSSRFLKRSLDIFASSVMLVVLAPLLLWITIAIKLESRGPVLFRQTRIGRNGRGFVMLKFRTMVDGADAMKSDLHGLNETDGVFKISDDPRLTRVGRFLRRTSLDELPQLVNVLRGEMSLVGPRPLVPDEDERVEGWHRHRLNMTPGMTGMWQILGQSRVPLPEMVKMDYLYGANWSLWEDIKILLRTVPHTIGRRGL
jgi:lipopolysaccharide/colanic/teichoic acid biosynthesis glycosyltransferase